MSISYDEQWKYDERNDRVLHSFVDISSSQLL